MKQKPRPKPLSRPRRYTGLRRHEPMRDLIRIHGPALACNVILASMLAIPVRHEMWMRWMI